LMHSSSVWLRGDNVGLVKLGLTRDRAMGYGGSILRGTVDDAAFVEWMWVHMPRRQVASASNTGALAIRLVSIAMICQP